MLYDHSENAEHSLYERLENALACVLARKWLGSHAHVS